MKKTPHKCVTGAALVLAVVAAAALAGSSQATNPGQNGRIAYMVFSNKDHWQIWVANSDLTGAKHLTHGRSDSWAPVWSPDGKRLAFDSNRTDRTPGNSNYVNDVFVTKPDGTGVKKLTRSKGVSENPAWSPNGSLIAFDHGSGRRRNFRTAIYVIGANGRNTRRLTLPGPHLNDYAPRFSPDGAWIVFTRKRGQADHAPAALFIVRPDGTGISRLTEFSMRVGQADWSPDGTYIVFDASPDPHGNGDIYVMGGPGGGTLVNVTNNPLHVAGSDNAVWSPDGTKILFVDNRYVNGVGTTGLATMNPDGSDRQFILNRTVDAGEPDWQSIPAAPATPRSVAANGQIAWKGFARSPTDTWSIFAGNPDGSQRHRLTHPAKGVHDDYPDWSPDGSKILFQRSFQPETNDPTIPDQVMQINADGSGLQQIGDCTDPCVANGEPQYSPNGQQIVYTRLMLAEPDRTPVLGVWVMDADGGNPHQITQLTTTPTSEDHEPTWSPLGAHIVFMRLNDTAAPVNKQALFIVDSSGGDLHRITPWKLNAGAPNWQPDGPRILFQSYRDCACSETSQVYTLDLGGNHLRRLTTASRNIEPSWSPNGNKIIYAHQPGAGRYQLADLWVMNANGKHKRPLVTTNHWESEPDWGTARPRR